MRLFGLVILLLSLNFLGACFSNTKPPPEDDSAEFKGDVSINCSDSVKCENNCNLLFVTDVDRLDKCLDSKGDEISSIKSVVDAMSGGNWDGIKADDLEVLTTFDTDIWLEYAQINNKPNVREMLLWVAEEQGVGALVNNNKGLEILEVAFRTLGSSASEDKRVQEGLKKEVDLETGETFLEVSALAENDEAFKAAHRMLKDHCDEDARCMKNLYCDVNEDVVFSKLNELELADEVDSDGGQLLPRECR